MGNQVLFTIRSNTSEQFAQKHSEMAAIATRGWMPKESIEIAERPDGGDKPREPLPPSPTPAPVPYFDIGEAIGQAGDVVELSVEGGCRFPMRGFDIAGGCGRIPDVERSGYGLFKAVGVKLGAFLRNYLKAEDAIHDEPHHQHDHFWSGFHFVPWEPDRALPEEWWQYAIGFFSIDQERPIPETTIPSGTELFTLRVKILPETKPGEYLVTCKDEYYHRQSRLRRLDLLFAGEPSGGFTKIETFPGKITVR